MNDDSERRVDRQRDTIHQAVSDLYGMDSKRSNFESLAGSYLFPFGVVEQSVLIQLVLYVSESELGSPDRDVEFR